MMKLQELGMRFTVKDFINELFREQGRSRKRHLAGALCRTQTG